MLRLALAKKSCSYCGGEGHTRRGCSLRKADLAEQQAEEQQARRRPGPQRVPEERRR